MQADLLHIAIRARDPDRLGRFYADLFDGDFFVHPVMTGLGIVIVKISHPDAIFRGLLEFWPWDVVWDGAKARFFKTTPQSSPTSYGHLGIRVNLDQAAILAELKRRNIPYRIEPRAPGFSVPTIDDPEGNMIELFPNVDHMPTPPEAIVPRERAPDVFAAIRRQFAADNARTRPEDGYPLLPS